MLPPFSFPNPVPAGEGHEAGVGLQPFSINTGNTTENIFNFLVGVQVKDNRKSVLPKPLVLFFSVAGATELGAAAQKICADSRGGLIVASTHDSTGLKHAFAGSTAEHMSSVVFT